MPDNQMQSAAGNPKQKLTVIIAVIIFLVIGWQVMGLFGGPKTPPVQPLKAPAPGQRMTQQSAAGGPGSANAAMTAAAVASTDNQVPQPAPVQTNSELIKLQQETEAKYITAVNELQMLKLQQEIAEVNQALAASKLSTMVTEKSISDLLVTKPVAPPPEDFGATAAPTKGAPQAPSAVDSATSYLLLSVSQQGESWSAVIGNYAKRYSVSVGDTLPPDGSVVSSIDKSSVTLEKDGKRKKLNLSNSL